MLGRLLNTLRSRLRAEEREWRAKNEIRNEHAIGWLHSAIFAMASRPTLVAWTMVASAIAFLGVTGLVDEQHWVIFRFEKFEIKDPIDYFSALWSVQAATVALVYPIVISFVAVLLQRRPGATVALNIYLHDSAALLAGLSALLLVVVMSLQYFFVPYLSHSRLAAWLALDGGWFLANAILMLHFLVRTFEFIRPERRLSIVQRYAVSVSWPEEVRGHLARHFFHHATVEGLVSGPSFDGRNKTPSLSLGKHGFETGNRLIGVHLGRGSQTLIDVRFRLLEWAWSRWRSRIRVEAPDPNAKRSPSDRFRTAPVVYIPLSPFNSYSGDLYLCQSDRAGEPSGIERFLIRNAFVFGRETAAARVTTFEVLEDLLAQALLSLRTGEAQSFQEDVTRLVETYVLLIRASQVTDSSGKIGSLAALTTQDQFGGTKIFERWGDVFYHLVSSTSQELSRGGHFVNPVLSAPRKIFARCHAAVAPQMLRRFVTMQSDFWQVIGGAWTRDARSRSSSNSAVAGTSNKMSESEIQYSRVLQNFVGIWEGFYSLLFPRRAEAWNVTSLKHSADWLSEHLSQTLVMLFDACRRDDRASAEWMTDVLLKWYEGSRHLIKENGAYSWRSDLRLVNLESFSDERALAPVATQSYGDDRPPVLTNLFKLALKHLWIDACCLATSTLISWIRRAPESALAADMVLALRTGTPLRAGDLSSQRAQISSLGELLEATLRQRVVHRVYTSRLDGFVNQIANLNRPDMVSGRVYSSVGPDGLASVDHGLLILMMTLVDRDPGGVSNLPRSLDLWLADHPDWSMEALGTLRIWTQKLSSDHWQDNAATYESLRTRIDGLGEFKATTESLRSRLVVLAEAIDKKRIQDLSQREIDPARLLDISQAGTKTAFSASTGGFPLPLFESVRTLDAGNARDFALRLDGISRGSLVTLASQHSPLTDSDWVAMAMREHVGVMVLREVVRLLKPKRVQARSARAYWNHFKNFAELAAEANLQALLVLENPTLPRWAYELSHPPSSRSASTNTNGIDVRRGPESVMDGYQCSFNSVAVFEARMAIGASLLLMRESLREVVFVRHSDGALIHIDHEADKTRPEFVSLVLRWKMRVDVAQHPSFRLAYGKSGSRFG